MPGSIRLGQDRRGRPRPLHSSSDHVRRAGVEELGGRGVGVLDRAAAGQQPVEQVGHHQQRLGHLQQRRVRLLHRQELERRVERQELQAGDPIDPLAWHQRDRRGRSCPRCGRPGSGRGCPAGRRRGRSGRSRPPRCQRRRRQARCGHRGRGPPQGGLDLVPEPGEVPVQGAAQRGPGRWGSGGPPPAPAARRRTGRAARDRSRPPGRSPGNRSSPAPSHAPAALRAALKSRRDEPAEDAPRARSTLAAMIRGSSVAGNRLPPGGNAGRRGPGQGSRRWLMRWMASTSSSQYAGRRSHGLGWMASDT